MTINLADDATHALNRAAAAAARDGEDAIDPGHVLAGVISQRDPTVVRLLARLEIDVEALPERMRTLPATYHGHLPFTSDSHDVLAVAVESATNSGQDTRGVHLLLGLLAAAGADVRETLRSWGLSAEALEEAWSRLAAEEEEEEKAKREAEAEPRSSPPPGSGAAVVALLAGALTACAPSAENGDREAGGLDDPFASAPADGPAPEIGPAPDDYRPTAAGAPSTDVWLGRLEGEDGGDLRVVELRNVTDRDGYDNQPFFDRDGSALYYAAAVDSTQTETFRYDWTSGVRERLTHTSDASEFSPTPIPGQDAFSAVREVRGRQFLWRYDADGNPLGPIFATVEPVGYHAWADGETAVMFVLGDPPTLQVGRVATGEVRTVARNPGRSIRRIPGTSEVSFVRKEDDEWWIERLDPRSGETARIVRTRPGREDHAWTPRGRILMGDGPSLFAWSEAEGWREVPLPDGEAAGDVSRLAVSPDGLLVALVRG